LKPRQRISPYANRKAHWLIAHHQVSQSPQALVAFNHYSSYRYTLSSNKQATDLIRYSNFRSKSPVIIPILKNAMDVYIVDHRLTEHKELADIGIMKIVPSTRFYRSFADFKAAIEATKDVKLT
jgi:hypothetical protein